MEWINALTARIPFITAANSRIEAFQRFAGLEQDFEPIETALSEFVLQVDSYIEMQSDISRGK